MYSLLNSKTVGILLKGRKRTFTNIFQTYIEKGSKNKAILINLFLRIGVFGTFFGHGVNAFMIKSSWIPLITAFGFSEDFAVKIMPFIGILDIIVAISILINPIKEILIWAIFWAFLTALSRPISGEPMIEFVERAANWVVPLILLLYFDNNNSSK